jgi:hypothetical protein
MSMVRHFISATLALVLLAGGIPFLACSAAMCAANTQCASIQCSCCGSKCLWTKKSHDTQHQSNQKGRCNQECPQAVAGKSVDVNPTQPLVAAILGTGAVQPVLVSSVCSRSFSIRQNFNSHPATLLSLSCALTI